MMNNSSEPLSTTSDILGTTSLFPEPGDPTHVSRAYNWVIGTTYFFGAAANIFLIIAIGSARSLWTTPNAYIINVCCVDLLLCCVSGPYTVLHLGAASTPIMPPTAACQFMAFLLLMHRNNVFISSGLLVTNRFVLITQPRQRYLRLFPPRAVLCSLLGAWLVSALLAAVPAISGWLSYNTRFHMCLYTSHHLTAYIYMSTLPHSVIGLGSMLWVCICYGCMVNKFRRSQQAVAGVYRHKDTGEMQQEIAVVTCGDLSDQQPVEEGMAGGLVGVPSPEQPSTSGGGGEMVTTTHGHSDGCVNSTWSNRSSRDGTVTMVRSKSLSLSPWVVSGATCRPGQKLSTSSVNIATGPKFLSAHVQPEVMLDVRDLKRRKTAVQESSSVWVNTSNQARQRKQYRVIVSMVTSCCMFIGCWLPLIAVSLWDGKGHTNIYLVCFCLAASNTLMNPILYGLCNRKIRNLTYKRIVVLLGMGEFSGEQNQS